MTATATETAPALPQVIAVGTAPDQAMAPAVANEFAAAGIYER